MKGAQAQGLTLTVIPAMPRLDAELLGLPPVMLAGELRRCLVRLTNSGSGALVNLRLAVGSPDVYCSRTQGASASSEGASGVGNVGGEPMLLRKPSQNRPFSVDETFSSLSQS